MDVVELTKELVSIPSITGDEGRIGRFIADRLEASGWRVVRQPVPPEGTATTNDPRINVLALAGDGVPDVVLTTHLDTVPPFIPPTEDGARLYGRGVCDAKGIFAAQWVAAERLRDEGRVNVALLGVVGEETDSIGAKLVHEVLPEARFIVDGEPTDLHLSSGAKGILALTLDVRGIAGHSAYPETGKSATHALIDALARLLAAELPADERFGPTTVNVGLLGGGVAPNVLAPSASATLMIRLGGPSAEVLDRVRALLGPDVGVAITSRSEPHTIHVPEGGEGRVVRFGSDVPYLARIGTPLLVGPGSIHDAHTVGEKIEKADLVAAADLYEQLARRLLTR
jgi:acetylornithine deacetylase